MNTHPQLWWFVARSSGVVAWALCTASVMWGLALSTRVLGKRPAGPWLLDLHRFLGALSVVFVGVHVGGLMADSYTHFGPTEILVPFASSWKALPVAWGVLAMYLLVAVEVTSLLKKRMPKKIWHRIHLASFGLYVASTIHLITAGTDARGVLTYTALASVAVVVFLTIYRVTASAGPAKRPRIPSPNSVARTGA